MDNVTLYYSVIILYNLLAKPNFLKWDDKEKMVKLDRLVMHVWVPDRCLGTQGRRRGRPSVTYGKG